MSFPTPHTIYVRRWTAAGEDPLGNPISGHGDPEPLRVHGIGPGPSRESLLAGRSTSEVAWNITAPAGTSVNSRDLVLLDLDGPEYEVDGEAMDWTRGPWRNPVAGVVIELKRNEG